MYSSMGECDLLSGGGKERKGKRKHMWNSFDEVSYVLVLLLLIVERGDRKSVV